MSDTDDSQASGSDYPDAQELISHQQEPSEVYSWQRNTGTERSRSRQEAAAPGESSDHPNSMCKSSAASAEVLLISSDSETWVFISSSELFLWRTCVMYHKSVPSFESKYFSLLQWCLCCTSWVLHCTSKAEKEISVCKATSWICYRSIWQWKLLRFFSVSPKSREIIGSFPAAEVQTQFGGHFCLSLQGKEVQSSRTPKIQSTGVEEEKEEVWEHAHAHREAPTDSLTSGTKEEAARQRFSVPFCWKTLWGETYSLKDGSWLWGRSSVLWDKYFLNLKIVNWNELCCASTGIKQWNWTLDVVGLTAFKANKARIHIDVDRMLQLSS